MRSTIKEIMTHNTFLFSCFLALTLPFLSVAHAAPIESECSYDKEKKPTIAFLESDLNKLKAYREKLAMVPKPAGFNPRDAEGNPVDVPWPPNLNIVDSFIRCFGKTYAEVYAGCSKK